MDRLHQQDHGRWSRQNRRLAAFVAATSIVGLPSLGYGTGITVSWIGGATNGSWSNSLNWFAGVIPGATTGTTNADTAVFHTNIGQSSVIIDPNRNIQNITFDTGATAFTVGSTTGNTLYLTGGGTTQIASTISSTPTETINAPLVLSGNYTFANNKPGANLIVGGAIAAGSAASTLNWTAGTGTFSGMLSDGSGTLNLKVSAGTVSLTASNGYTGGTTLSGGTLILANDNALSTGTLNFVGGNLVGGGATRNVATPITVSGVSATFNGAAFTFSGNVATSGGTHTFNFNSPTTISGSVYLSTSASVGGILSVSGNSAVTISGNIADYNGVGGTPGSLWVAGSGSVSLPNANSFTGGVSLYGGTLTVGSDQSLGSGTVTFGGGTLMASGGGVRTLANPITFNFGGNARLSGVQDINLAGEVNSPTDGGAISNNLPAINTATISGNVRINEGSGCSLTFGGPGKTVITGNISDFGGGPGYYAFNYNGSGTLVLAHSNSFTGVANIASGTVSLQATGAVSGEIISSGQLVETVDNAISGTAVLEISGGTTILSNANNYSGGTGVGPGTLLLGNANALGSGSLTMGGALGFTNGLNTLATPILWVGGALVGSQDMTLSGSITSANFQNSASIINNLPTANTATLSGNMYLCGNTFTYSGFTIAGSGNTVITGTIANYQGTGALPQALTFTGSGTLTLAGSCIYTGQTIVNGTGTVNVSTMLSSSYAVVDSGAVNLKVANAILAGIEVDNGTLIQSIDNAISGSSVVLIKGGTAMLSNANNYTGQTTLSGGTLIVGNSAALGSSPTLSFNGGSLAALNGTTTIVPQAINLGGTCSLGGTGNLVLSGAITNSGLALNNNIAGPGAATLSGNIYASSSGTSGKSLRIGGSGTTFVTGTIYDYNGAGSPGSLIFGGTGTLALLSPNSLTGGVTLTSGTLALGNNNALGNGTFNFNGGTLTAFGQDLSLTQPVSLGSSTVTLAGTQNMTFQSLMVATNNSTQFVNNLLPTATATLAGNLYLPPAGTFIFGGSGRTVVSASIYNYGTGAFTNTLVYNGTGTLALAASNAYVGGTRLSGGTLVIGDNGALGAGSLTVVNLGTNDTSAIQSSDATDRAPTTNGTTPTDMSFNTPANAHNLVLGTPATGNLTFGAFTSAGTLGTRTLTINCNQVGFSSFATGTTTVNMNTAGSGAILVTGNLISGAATSGISIGNSNLFGIQGTLPSGSVSMTVNNSAVLGTHGTFTRTVGTSITSGIFGWLGSGGLAAYGLDTGTFGTANNNLAVRLYNNTGSIAWGAAATNIPLAASLVLGNAHADGSVDFQNGLDLAGAARTIQVDRSTLAGPADVDALISGVIANSSAAPAGMIKSGAGVLVLSASDTFTGTTLVTAGTLSISGALSNSATVTVDATSAAANLVLNSANALAPSAQVTGLGSTSFAPTITVNAGLSLTSLSSAGTSNFTSGTSTITSIGGVGTLLVGSGVTVNASTRFNPGAVNNSGTLNVNGGTTNLVGTIDGTGTLAVANGVKLTAAHIRQAMLMIGQSATVSISSNGTPTGTSAVTTLGFNSNGTLDLTNNGIVILDTTALGMVRSLIAQAYDAGGAARWDQSGITSGTAAADPTGHAVGYGLASMLGSTSFNGITFSDAVLARYTLVGDSGLKGTVDLSDYTKVVLNLGKSNAGWSDGNFDYSGNVNLGDYTAVIRNLGRSDGQSTVFNATGPSAQQVKASALTLHTTPAVTQASTATDVTLLVNPTNGRVTLVNALQTGQAVITAYTINSPSQSLLPFSADGGGKYLANALENNPSVFYRASNGLTYNLWTGIKNVSTFIGEGFSNHYNANVDSTWTNYTLATSGYALGTLFKRLSSGGTKDLVFQWEDANLNTYTSVVTYVGAVPEPGSVSLIAMGAIALLGRRRRRSSK